MTRKNLISSCPDPLEKLGQNNIRALLKRLAELSIVIWRTYLIVIIQVSHPFPFTVLNSRIQIVVTPRPTLVRNRNLSQWNTRLKILQHL
jgi:hypothetical protein